jgi:hypothetical protein
MCRWLQQPDGQAPSFRQEGIIMARLFRRRWPILVLVPIVLLAGAYVWMLTLPSSGCITKANYDRIQVDMTIKEVNEILGEDAANPIMRLWEDGHRSQAAALYVAVGTEIMPRASIWLEIAEDRVVSKQFNPPNGWEICDRTLAPMLVAIGLKKPPSMLPPAPIPR